MKKPSRRNGWIICVVLFLLFADLKLLFVRDSGYSNNSITKILFYALLFSFFGFIAGALLAILRKDRYWNRVLDNFPWAVICVILFYGGSNLYYDYHLGKRNRRLAELASILNSSDSANRKRDEENLNRTDKSSVNDIFEGTLYRNSKYKFRIQFIDGWEFRKGDSRATVIKSVRPDSAKSISITIGYYPNSELNSNGLTDSELLDLKKDLVKRFQLQQMSPKEFTMTRGLLNNFPAVFITFKTTQKKEDIELEYQHYQVNCISDGKVYVIASAMPSIFYTTEEERRIKNVINSFVFEKAF